MKKELVEMTEIIKDFTLEIPVDDIEQSVEWYVKNLGFELISPAMGIAELKLASGGRICLFRPDSVDESSYWYVKDAGSYRVRACIRVADIEKLREDLANSGIKVSDYNEGGSCGRTFQ